MGNVERVLVVVIMATIVVILALAIWGLGQDEPGIAGGGGAGAAVLPDKEVPVVLDGVSGGGAPAGDDEDSMGAVIPVSDGALGGRAAGPDAPPIAQVSDPPRDDGARPISEPAPRTSPPPNGGIPLDSPVPGMRRYTVGKGDTYSTIAFKVLGDRNLWKEIADANKDVDPKRLTVGMEILVPARGDAGVTRAPAPAPEPVPPLLASSSPSATGKKYVTKKGDTLYGIAKRELNDAAKWRRIFEINRGVLPSEKVVPVGLTLDLPLDAR